MDEIREEGEVILKEGFKYLFVLIGESSFYLSVEYIGEVIEILREKFFFIGIEVYLMEVEEYKYIVDKGVEGLIVY